VVASVFVSYSSADYGVAQEVERNLEANGLSVFDTQAFSAGNVWINEVDGALKTADALIAIISSNYSSSAYATSEWTAALAGDKRIIPVIIESNARVPALLAPYLGIDISDPRTRADKLRLLAEQIKTMSNSPGSRTTEIGLLEKRLTESRVRWDELARASALVQRRDSVRVRFFRQTVTLSVLVLATASLVLFAVLNSSNVVQVVTTLAFGLFGGFIGSFSKAWVLRKRLRASRGEVVSDEVGYPESHATSKNGVRP